MSKFCQIYFKVITRVVTCGKQAHRYSCVHSSSTKLSKLHGCYNATSNIWVRLHRLNKSETLHSLTRTFFVQWVQGILSQWLKQPEGDAMHSPPSVPRLRTNGAVPVLHPYAIMACTGRSFRSQNFLNGPGWLLIFDVKCNA